MATIDFLSALSGAAQGTNQFLQRDLEERIRQAAEQRALAQRRQLREEDFIRQLRVAIARAGGGPEEVSSPEAGLGALSRLSRQAVQKEAEGEQEKRRQSLVGKSLQVGKESPEVVSALEGEGRSLTEFDTEEELAELLGIKARVEEKASAEDTRRKAANTLLDQASKAEVRPEELLSFPGAEALTPEDVESYQAFYLARKRKKLEEDLEKQFRSDEERLREYVINGGILTPMVERALTGRVLPSEKRVELNALPAIEASFSQSQVEGAQNQAKTRVDFGQPIYASQQMIADKDSGVLTDREVVNYEARRSLKDQDPKTYKAMVSRGLVPLPDPIAEQAALASIQSGDPQELTLWATAIIEQPEEAISDFGMNVEVLKRALLDRLESEPELLQPKPETEEKAEAQSALQVGSPRGVTLPTDSIKRFLVNQLGTAVGPRRP